MAQQVQEISRTKVPSHLRTLATLPTEACFSRESQPATSKSSLLWELQRAPRASCWPSQCPKPRRCCMCIAQSCPAPGHMNSCCHLPSAPSDLPGDKPSSLCQAYISDPGHCALQLQPQAAIAYTCMCLAGLLADQSNPPVVRHWYFISVCAHRCGHTRRPEADAGCPSASLVYYFFEPVSHWAWFPAVWPGRLASKSRESSCPHLSGTAHDFSQPSAGFSDGTEVLVLAWDPTSPTNQALFPTATSSALHMEPTLKNPDQKDIQSFQSFSQLNMVQRLLLWCHQSPCWKMSP